jgi:hypothetical protein
MADEKKYLRLAQEGESPAQVYRTMRADGLGWIPSVRILRELFHLSLEEAKEVSVVADGLASSLTEHEQRLVEGMEQAVTETSKDNTKK